MRQRENKKRRRKGRRYFTWLVLLVVFLGLAYYLLNLPIWQIKEVVVNGTKMLSANEIKTLSGVPLSGNLFFSSLERTRANLSKISTIKKFKLYRIPPGIILINIEERQPVASIVLAKQSFLVDQEGYLLNYHQSLTLNVPDLAGLPVIAGLDAAMVENNQRLNSQVAKVALQVVVELSRYLELKTIQIELVGLSDLTLLLDDLLRVKLGGTEEIEKKMTVFKALLPTIAGRWPQVNYIDVRFPDNPVIRFKSAS